MDLATSLKLYGQRPTEWYIDLTPPGPEPVQPDLSVFENGIKQALLNFSRQIGKDLQIETGVGYASLQAHRIAEELTRQHRKLIESFEEIDDKQHGTYVAPIVPKKGVTLPKRKTNTGPPQSAFAKHGRRNR